MTIHKVPDEAPYSLLDLTASIISKHPLSIASSTREGYELWPNVAMPQPTAEALYKSCKKDDILDNRQLSLFTNGSKMPLGAVDLEGSLVTDKMFNLLVRAQASHLRTLSVRNCRLLTHEANDLLGNPQVFLPRLMTLNLGNLVGLFKRWADDTSDVRRYMESTQNESSARDISPILPPVTESSSGHFTWDYRSATPFQHCISGDLRASSSLSSPADAAAASSRAGSSAKEDGMGTKSALSSVPMDHSGIDGADSASPDVFSYGSLEGSRNRMSQYRISRSVDRSASTGFVNHVTAMCPNLVAFTLHGDSWEDVFSADMPITGDSARPVAFLSMVLEPIPHLLYLDLSYWQLSSLRFLHNLRRLETLVLHDVAELSRVIDVICGIKTLKHLDISQTDAETGKYPTPARTLHRIITSLPLLRSLDITSTNLASHPSEGDEIWHTMGRLNASRLSESDDANTSARNGAQPVGSRSPQRGRERDVSGDRKDVGASDIIGLRGLQEPLDFLGLYNCDGACNFRHLPARSVTGDADETQVLRACEQYLQRAGLIHRVLSDVYRIYRYGDPRQSSRALLLVVRAMEGHVTNAEVQVSGSAALFYIMKNVEFSSALRNRVVSAFLTALREHTEENVLVRNCCLSLCQFEVPKDLMFAYSDTARLLLDVIQHHPNDVMTHRIVVYLLNSMACHVEGEQKVAVGELGAVVKILGLIEKRLDLNECDEVMEVSWSFLWNITDETPSNCEKFLRGNGMQLFHRCYEKFPDKNDLLRNMMGLMGNIAEVPALRHHLMKAEYVSAFVALMENFNEGIEISYNSAGVLSHMVSDAENVWPPGAPSRTVTSSRIAQATERWSLQEKRFINYRSFEPIIRLLPLFDYPAAQQWAVWALANLTTVDKSKKYCRFVRDEGGVPWLEAIRSADGGSRLLKKWAELVLQNVALWQHEGARSEDEDGKRSTSVAAEDAEDD